ncbi:hypothetical protein PAPHI01_1028 [Pancytospora philotis]|nr:hypothetical protein PAPHI01_1028 [Pancytospora philotis]
MPTQSPMQQLSNTGFMPPYSGLLSEKVDEWATTFEMMAIIRKLSEDEKKLFLRGLMAGSARTFYEYVGGEKFTSKQLLGKLRERFAARTFYSDIEEFDDLTKRPDETWASFVERFIVIARRLEFPETHLVGEILGFLPESILGFVVAEKAERESYTIPMIMDALLGDLAYDLEMDEQPIPRSDEIDEQPIQRPEEPAPAEPKKQEGKAPAEPKKQEEKAPLQAKKQEVKAPTTRKPKREKMWCDYHYWCYHCSADCWDM